MVYCWRNEIEWRWKIKESKRKREEKKRARDVQNRWWRYKRDNRNRGVAVKKETWLKSRRPGATAIEIEVEKRFKKSATEEGSIGSDKTLREKIPLSHRINLIAARDRKSTRLNSSHWE